MCLKSKANRNPRKNKSKRNYRFREMIERNESQTKLKLFSYLLIKTTLNPMNYKVIHFCSEFHL